MSARVEWTGLAEFKTALHQLPAELNAEAQQIVIDTAQQAGRDVEAAYPTHSGKLKSGVRTTVETSRAGTSGIVKSTAPHSHIFERGTRSRRTSSGANRGVMPVAPPDQQMIPIIVRARRAMVAKLIDLVQRAGFVVTQS